MGAFDKVNDREDYIDLSGIRHFIYCKRCWSLARIEGIWVDNMYTIQGSQQHKNTDDEFKRETRNDLFYSRGMPVTSDRYKIQGKLDTVEFYRDVNGIQVNGREGLWIPRVVEYKRSKSKDEDSKNAKRIQLIAEVICLEEMLGVTINEGYIYYRKQNRREKVDIDDKGKEWVLTTVKEMYECLERGEILQERKIHKGKGNTLTEQCEAKKGGVVSYKRKLYI